MPWSTRPDSDFNAGWAPDATQRNADRREARSGRRLNDARRSATMDSHGGARWIAPEWPSNRIHATGLTSAKQNARRVIWSVSRQPL